MQLQNMQLRSEKKHFESHITILKNTELYILKWWILYVNYLSFLNKGDHVSKENKTMLTDVF
jgi:hypothetical protein